MTDFNTIWQSITDCEGQTFATPSGQLFAYDVTENGLSVRRSDLFLSKEALELEDGFSYFDSGVKSLFFKNKV